MNQTMAIWAIETLANILSIMMSLHEWVPGKMCTSRYEKEPNCRAWVPCKATPIELVTHGCNMAHAIIFTTWSFTESGDSCWRSNTPWKSCIPITSTIINTWGPLRRTRATQKNARLFASVSATVLFENLVLLRGTTWKCLCVRLWRLATYTDEGLPL